MARALLADHRARTTIRRRRFCFAFEPDHEQLVLVSDVVAHAHRKLVPDSACAVAKTPRLDALHARRHLRARNPEEEHAGVSSRYIESTDLIEIHCRILVLDRTAGIGRILLVALRRIGIDNIIDRKSTRLNS